jgi:hypothetical protein
VWCSTECDREGSIFRRPWPTRGCRAMEEEKEEEEEEKEEEEKRILKLLQ